jgi:DNA-binding NarL/FixJ family response regulator
VTGVIRLVIVDDHPAILDAIAPRAAAAPDIEVVGSARDADAAARLIESGRPDVVLSDIQLDGTTGGLELLERFGRTGRPAFLMLSAFDTPSIVRAAFERGAAGYLLKSAEIDEVLEAVRTVAAGNTAFSADALRSIRTARRRPSDRELQVLRLVAAGASNGEIGLHLTLSEKTVESHLRRLFDRYDVLSRTELALLAVREGWIDDPAVREPA